MSNINAASNNIYVFPSAVRGNQGGSYVSSRFYSEKTMTNYIAQIIDSGSFCITETYDTTKPFEFNIGGYYFKVTNIGDITSQFNSPNTVIYATINLSDSAVFPEIEYGDENNEYKGLVFTDVNPDVSKYKQLAILTNVSGEWEVPNDSKKMFDGTRVDFDIEVDGGLID